MLFSQTTKYTGFWKWFAAHSGALHRITGRNDPLLDSLGGALAKVHPSLTFELGPPTAHRDFVLSADGIRDAFPEVEALHSAAPKLTEWHLIKFRPRRSPSNVLMLNGQQFDPARARFLLVKDDPGKVGIVLFLEGYSKAQHDLFAKAGFLILDEALGEYDIETRVGAIDFLGGDSPYYARSRPLAELPAVFDAYFSKP